MSFSYWDTQPKLIIDLETLKKYFKFPAESNVGIGIQYIEFDDNDLPIRQIECYGDRLFNSNQKYHDELGVMGLCEQKLTEFGVKIGTPIEAQEFDSLWTLSSQRIVTSLKI